MEIWRGKVVGLSKPEEGGPMECNVGSCRVQVHADLERVVTEGEELLVAGSKDDDKLQALAAHNLDTDELREVDSSNYVLLIGLGGFFGFLGFILGFQNKVEGNMGLASASMLMSLGGVGLLLWALQYFLKIKRCANWVRFAD